MNTATSNSAAYAYTDWWSVNNAMTMCAVLLVFAFFVLGLTGYLMKNGLSGAVVLRVFGTVLVIIMATFLVVAGYDEQALGAPLGLLGTIVGYLLGKDTGAREYRTRNEPGTDPQSQD